MAEENLLRIDVEKRTTRGRVCPRCGGKIIPSNRAVYQSTADPTGAFPIWQCERCGYEIGAERLKAVPDTTLCVKCKAETEKLIKRGFTPA